MYIQDASKLAGDAPTASGPDDARGYRPDPGLVDAVNVALMLNKPLLVTGEPGTGKTQLASSIAWQLWRQGALSSDGVEKFEAKSTSVARDLFYTFDSLQRFHAAHSGGSTDNRDYLTFNALGRAILNALPDDAVRRVVPASWQHRGPLRSVVLIDEIDKAPRDFPNDLLNEIDQMFFRIAELSQCRVPERDSLRKELRPIVVITSNSEKTLPDPFLRRCVYYNIPFPKAEALADILLARLPSLERATTPLARDALDFFHVLRTSPRIKRRVSPAELIQWLTFMLLAGARPSQRLAAVERQAEAGLPALIKEPDDQDTGAAELKTFIAQNP